MFDAAASNPRAASVRIQSDQSARTGGQRKHDLRHAPIPGYVDQNRMHLNSILLEPQTGPALRKVCERRRAKRTTQRAMKSNASVAMSGIIVFGKDIQADFEALTIERQDEAYRAVANAVAKRLNTTLTGLVAHRDETAPHAHFQLPAYDLDGNALSMTTKRAVTSELQTITADVMKRFVTRVERGQGKYERLKAGAEFADTVHRSVAELHHDLRPEIKAAEDRLTALRVDADKVAERVAKLQKKEDLVAKEVKRLEDYERRLKNKQDELKDLEAEITRLQGLTKAEQDHTADARRIADEQWDRASAALDAQSAAEAQIEALGVEAKQMREKATTEAQEAADAILEMARTQATRVIGEAYSDARIDVAAITRSMLSDDGKEFIDLKAEVGQLRKMVMAQSAFIDLFKDTFKKMIPDLYEEIADKVNSLWSKSSSNPDREPDKQQRTHTSRSFGR